MAGVRRSLSPRNRANTIRNGPSLIAFFIWTFFWVSTAIVYLWAYNQVDVVAAGLVEKEREIVVFGNGNLELRAVIGNLSRMERISHIAHTRLNMYIPAAESLIVILSAAE